MFRKSTVLFPLAAFFLAAPALTFASHPSKLPPIKVDAAIIFRFNVKVGHKYQHRPLAPWYTYFPQDPNLTGPAQPSPYPHWPQQFPPNPNPVPAPGSMGYLPPVPGLQQPPGNLPPVPGSPYQPVGWFQGPSYWYGR